MEFLGFVQGVHTLASARAIASKAEESDATIVADVFHLMRGGGNIDDIRTLASGEMSIFHINDLPDNPPPTQQTDADRVMLGDGIANLTRVIQNLRAIAYDGPISLELFNEKLWRADPLEVCRMGVQRMRELLA
jgi:sugar phosphate isomerase/epimerase